MVNYQNGKIYKIENMSGDMCYIGSTTKDYLSKRMVQHRSMYKGWQADHSKDKYSVFEIFDKVGIENCRIVLIELCPCDTKDELTRREAHYIRTSVCVNKYLSHITTEEQKENNKKYYNKNKVQINELKLLKHTCACGSIHRKADSNRHEKTTKHINYLANQPIDV